MDSPSKLSWDETGHGLTFLYILQFEAVFLSISIHQLSMDKVSRDVRDIYYDAIDLKMFCHCIYLKILMSIPIIRYCLCMAIGLMLPRE